MIEQRRLGNTEVFVSRIGISSSFGAEEAVYEEALSRGCNYFNWGTFIKGRSTPFRRFVKRVTASGKREQLVIGLLSYSHTRFLGDVFLNSALKQLGIEYVDGLLLGYYPKRPPQRILDWAQKAKEQGLIRTIGITTHNRDLVATLAPENIIDYFHIRYNAVHRGAEVDIFPKIKERSVGLVSFTATAWGKLLSGKKMAEGVDPPTAGDCYRFVLARPEIDCCMMGVKSLAMLQQNLDGLGKGPMTEEELATMRDIGDRLYGRR